jgi:hypothetical protein
MDIIIKKKIIDYIEKFIIKIVQKNIIKNGDLRRTLNIFYRG